MAEIIIFHTKNDKPITQFQKDLNSFLIDKEFLYCSVDEDGELIMFGESSYSNQKWIGPYRYTEFINGSETRNQWISLQNRYDEGER